jgi:PAS domain S-box-containing protein
MLNLDKFYVHLLDSINEAVIVTNLSGVITYWNKGAEKLYKWKASEVIDKNIVDVTPSKMSKKQADEIMVSLKKGQEWNGEFEVTDKEGRIFYAQVNNMPLKNEKDELIGIIGVSKDISEARKTEEELKRKEILLRSSVESPKDMIILSLDREYRYLYFNKAHNEVMKAAYGREPKLGACIFDFMTSKEDIKKIKERYDKGLQGKNDVSTAIYGDKKKRYYEININPILDENKEIIGITSFAQDITDWQEKQNRLIESQNLLETIASNYPNSYVSIIEKDLTVGFSAGQEFKRLMLNPNDFNGLSLKEVFGENEEIVKENYLKTFKGEETTFELFINNQYQLYKTVPLVDKDNKIERILVVVENITARKENEKLLIESEEKFRTLASSSPAGVYLTDKDGKSTYANPRWLEMAGMTLEEALGKGWEKAIHPDDRDWIPDQWYKSVQSNGKWSYQYRFLNKNGETFWVDGTANAIHDDKNKIVGYVGINTDITEQKKAEEKLKESEEKYRNLVESSPDGVVLVNKLGKVISVNKSFLETTGYKKEDFEGKHFLKIPSLLKQDFSFYANIFKDLLLEKKIKPIEFKWKHADGQIRVGEAKTKIFRQDGKVVGIQAVLRDVTDRVAFQKAITESEEKYRRIVEDSIQGLVVATDNPVRIIFASKPMEDISGYSPKELMNFDSEQLIGLIHPDDRERFFNTFQKRIKGESLPSRSEYKIIHKDKDLRWVELFSSIITFNGQVASQTVFIDITERKKAEIALDESQNLLQKAELISDQGSLKWDIKNDLWSFSENWLKITGFNHSGISKEELMQIVHPDDRTKVNKAFEDALNNIKPYALEHRIIRKDNGAIRFLKAMGEVQYSASGEPEFMVGIANDITEQKKTEEELENYRKNLEDLVKERTHDLEEKNKELEKYNQLFVGREFRIKELKERVKELEELLKDKI